MSRYQINNGTFYAVPEQSDDLKHYGVPGMKWGHRKNPEVQAARAAYKKANKEYNKSFNRAYNRAHQAYSFSKKKREANDARWEDAFNKADALRDAKKTYKQVKATAKATAKAKAKAERALAKIEKQNKKDFVKTRSKEIQKGSSVVGKMWNAYTGGHKIQAEIEYNLRKYKD